MYRLITIGGIAKPLNLIIKQRVASMEAYNDKAISDYE